MDLYRSIQEKREIIEKQWINQSKNEKEQHVYGREDTFVHHSPEENCDMSQVWFPKLLFLKHSIL